MTNQKISKIFNEIADLEEIKGTPFKPKAYRKAADFLNTLKEDLSSIYKRGGIKELEKLPAIGKSTAQKIEEFLRKKRIKYHQELKDETAIRQIVTHYFKTKDLSLEQLKKSARKRKIIYSRFTRPAKQLLELSGSVQIAQRAIDKVSEWAKTRNLDYAIETVFKKWLELDRLKPKEITKKPFFQGNPMVWSETKKKWYVISPHGDWLEFAAREKDIEWKIAK